MGLSFTFVDSLKGNYRRDPGKIYGPTRPNIRQDVIQPWQSPPLPANCFEVSAILTDVSPILIKYIYPRNILPMQLRDMYTLPQPMHTTLGGFGFLGLHSESNSLGFGMGFILLYRRCSPRGIAKYVGECWKRRPHF